MSPRRPLPVFTREEVNAHRSKDSCYVSLNTKVYDVTDFINDHPGGVDVILDCAGHDIDQILRDPASHTHSDMAYTVLEEFLVGYLALDKEHERNVGGSKHSHGYDYGKQVNGNAATSEHEQTRNSLRTGAFYEESLSKDTDYEQDYKEHKFLDLSRPLLHQLWFGGFSKDFYLDQVHRPRHYKGGQSAALFGNFLEPLSKTTWWIIPTLWLPCLTYGTCVASQGFDRQLHTACYWLFGLFFWSIIEYVLHRFLFHLD